MIERLFIGWQQPALREVVRILLDRYARGDRWDMRSLLIVLPGGQARRRLMRLLGDSAAKRGYQLNLPVVVTPASLPGHLYKSSLPIATPMQSSFAWQKACAAMSQEDACTLAPSEENPRAAMARVAIAEEARLLRETACAEGMTIQDLAASCGQESSAASSQCLAALARLELGYLAIIADAGLVDRDHAIQDALANDVVSCSHTILLVGTQDLSGILRQLIRRLESPVVVAIPAPEGERDGFDDVGCLIPDAWHDKSIPIPEESLRFVNAPADEAENLRTIIAGLNGRYARDEITIGVGDEDNAAGLARRLSALDLPAYSPYGPLLRQSRPGTLLAAIQHYLAKPTVRNFAVLVRHPDLEIWLEKALSQNYGSNTHDAGGEPRIEAIESRIADKPLISLLDCYIAECLPEKFPPTKDPGDTFRPLRKTLDFIRHKVLAARDLLEGLLAPLASPDHVMPNWAEPIADILRTVYSVEPIEERAAERALEALADGLAALKDLPRALAPTVSGPEALNVLLKNADSSHLASNELDGGLEMMGWLELSLDDAPVLLLTGLHEGCVPANSGDDPLLSESQREELGLSHDRRRYARDAFLLRVMLESREKVSLIVKRRGVDGNPLTPSRLLFACDGATAARRAQLFAASESAPTSALFIAGDARRLSPPRPAPLAEPLSSLPITAFRDYLACPYRFYLSRVLNLACQDDSAYEMDNRLFGNLLHDCLSAFARSPVANSTKPGQIREFLHEELRTQARKLFGAAIQPVLHLQIRQAGRRLDAFSEWQAQTVREGWRIEKKFVERDMTATILVDEMPFEIHGRVDRVDCSESGIYRLIDYKTGDKRKSPDDAHRAKARGAAEAQWVDLQLPLYRWMLSENDTQIAPDGLGYALLSADLAPITVSTRGRVSGGAGYIAASWDSEDCESALACAADIIRKIRRNIFWPPTDPPAVRIEWNDPLSPICLDSCRNRAEWLGLRGETA